MWQLVYQPCCFHLSALCVPVCLLKNLHSDILILTLALWHANPATHQWIRLCTQTNTDSNVPIVSPGWDYSKPNQRPSRMWLSSNFDRDVLLNQHSACVFKNGQLIFILPPRLFQDTLQEPGEECQKDHRSAVCDQEEVFSPHLGEQEQLPVRVRWGWNLR